MLERYQLPKSLLQSSKNSSFGKVFRDDDELSASLDLGATLEGALQESNSLIVMCSSESACSRWVNMEIREFRKLNPSHPVILILVPGNKIENSMPSSLEEYGISPLFVNFPKSMSSSHFHKIVAAAIAVNYDAVRNRFARQVRQARITRAIIAAGVTIGFLTMLSFGYRESFVGTTDRLFDRAQIAYVDGRHQDVVKLATAAIPEDRTILTPRHKSMLLLARKSAFLNQLNWVALPEKRTYFESTSGGPGFDNSNAYDFISNPNLDFVIAFSRAGALVKLDAIRREQLVLATENGSRPLGGALLNDGQQFAMVYDDGSLTLRSADTGQELGSFRHSNIQVLSVSNIPGQDGLIVRLLSEILDPTASSILGSSNSVNPNLQESGLGLDQSYLWDPSSNPTFNLADLQLLGDGRVFFDSVGDSYWALNSKNAILFYPKIGEQPRWKLEVGGASVLLAVHPERSSLIAIGGSNGVVEAFDAEVGRSVQKYRTHSSHVRGISFDSTGSRLVTFAEDKTAVIHDVVSGQVIKTIEHDGQFLTNFAIHSNGKVVITSGEDGTTKAWTTQAGRLLYTLVGNDSGGASSDFIAGGDMIVSIENQDKGIKFWSSSPPRMSHTWYDVQDGAVTSSISNDGSKFAIGYDSGAIDLIVAIPNYSKKTITNKSSSAVSIDLTDDGSHYLVCFESGDAEVREFSGDIVHKFSLESTPVHCRFGGTINDVVWANTNGLAFRRSNDGRPISQEIWKSGGRIEHLRVDRLNGSLRIVSSNGEEGLSSHIIDLTSYRASEIDRGTLSDEPASPTIPDYRFYATALSETARFSTTDLTVLRDHVYQHGVVVTHREETLANHSLKNRDILEYNMNAATPDSLEHEGPVVVYFKDIGLATSVRLSPNHRWLIVTTNRKTVHLYPVHFATVSDGDLRNELCANVENTGSISLNDWSEEDQSFFVPIGRYPCQRNQPILHAILARLENSFDW